MLNIKPVIRNLSIVRDSQHNQMAVTDGKAHWWLYTYDEAEARSVMSGIAALIEMRGCAVIINDTIKRENQE
jgi:hypothetical protein